MASRVKTVRNTHLMFLYASFFSRKECAFKWCNYHRCSRRNRIGFGKRVTAVWTRGGYRSRPFIDSINAIRMCTYVQYVYIRNSYSLSLSFCLYTHGRRRHRFGVGCVHWLQVVVIEGSRVADYVRVYMRARWLRRVRPVKPQRGLPRSIIIIYKCARSSCSSSSGSTI